MRKDVIYVDMDDTICDFSGAAKQALIDEPNILYPQSQYGFFTSLEPIKGAIVTLNMLALRYDVWILTRPSVLNPLCYTEKRVWVEKHLGLDWCHKLIMCPDKSLLRGDYLIDDVVWPGFVGKQYRFGPNHYNWDDLKLIFTGS